MNKQISRIEDEYARIFKVINFRLPHSFKKIGIIGAALILAFLIGYKFLGDNTLIAKDVLRSLVLAFMLMASLSKDKIEDEYQKHVRFQSYILAFVFAASYAIFIPLISIVLDYLITYITGDGTVSFYEISAFEVLFTLLGMQLLAHATLKKMGSV